MGGEWETTMQFIVALSSTETLYYYGNCEEAFEKGESCSGVYLIKPDNLPSFEVSVLVQALIQYWPKKKIM